MIVEKSFEQRSDLWFKARVGNPGASSMDNIITSQGKPSAQRKEYLYTMASEVVRGESEDTFQSEAMLTGLAREQEARICFELIYGVEVETVALVYKDEKKRYHISPDGLIGTDAGIEIKAPKAKTLAKYLCEDKVPTKYFVQIQSSLYISGRKYWWFVVYVPGMKLFVKKVGRDEVFIKKLAVELDRFIEDLDATVDKIR